MSVADKYTTLNTEKIPQVYEAGKEAEHKEWWNAHTDDWTRGYFRYGFFEWRDKAFSPPRTIYPVEDVRYMFQNALITSIDETQVDFSYFTGSFRTTFSGMSLLESLRLKFGNNISGFYADTFTNCTALKNLTIIGVITHNNFNVQWSTNLTHDSLMSIINALEDKSADTSGTVWEVTLGETNIAKLTDAEQLIAQQKGWTLT